jgi:hypothetical protein
MTRPRVAIDKLRQTRTKIMVNLGNRKTDTLQSSMLKSKVKTVATRRAIGEKPARAERLPDQKSDGVLQVRMEFIIIEHIGIHPTALGRPRQGRGASSFPARPNPNPRGRFRAVPRKSVSNQHLVSLVWRIPAEPAQISRRATRAAS